MNIRLGQKSILSSSLAAASLALGLIAATASPAKADSTNDERAPTFYVMDTEAYVTHKSKLVGDNDTSLSNTYGLGANAGGRHSLGLFYRAESESTTFAYSKGSYASTWRDTGINYRFGWFSIGAVLAQAQIKAVKAGTTLFDLNASGYGGTVEAQIPLGKSGFLTADATFVNVLSLTEANKKPVKLGMRIDGELYGTFDVTKKLLSMLIGMRYRTTSATAPGASGTETISAPFLGLRGALYF